VNALSAATSSRSWIVSTLLCQALSQLASEVERLKAEGATVSVPLDCGEACCDAASAAFDQDGTLISKLPSIGTMVSEADASFGAGGEEQTILDPGRGDVLPFQHVGENATGSVFL